MDEPVWNEERKCWTVKETEHFFAEIIPLLFDRYAIVMTPKAVDGVYWDRWDYYGFVPTLKALLEWDIPHGYQFTGGIPASEPEGWIRHLPTGRRRKDGDPSTEEARH